VLLDINMPGLSGLETLERIKARHARLPVIMMTAQTGVETVVSAMQLGAHDYIPKPLEHPKLMAAVANALTHHQMSLRLTSLEREAAGEGFPGIIGESDAMAELFRQMDRVTESDITVLIHGESGTGKELIARGLHSRSGRRNGPFVALNCAAIAETLQESELFGHERGAFTGATAKRLGAFEQADGGTLFLDEVAELPPGLQAALLRATQERSFRRVGGAQDIASDFRLLAATHRELENEVKAGRFREDLYYRIAVFELDVPPLRDRHGDVVRLIRHAVARWAKQNEAPPPRLSATAMKVLTRYPWPGNVRELDNALQRAFALAREGLVRSEDLPRRIREAAAVAPIIGAEGEERARDEASADAADLPYNLEEVEQLIIERALRQTEGNLSEVVRMLGIGRTTLYRKLKKYGIR
jgi:DNA-binding NtrC family response regulator